MSKIQKWGNSLAIRIPGAMARQLEVSAGTPVEVRVEEDAIVVRPRKHRKYRLKELLKNCKPRQLHGEVDFGPDAGREVVE